MPIGILLWVLSSYKYWFAKNVRRSTARAFKYVKEFGEGIDRICNELETKGCAIPSFHIDAFILKATLMAEWTTEKEFDRPSTAQVPPK